MFGRLFRFAERKSTSISSPDDRLFELFAGGARSISKKTVNAETAMRVPAVAAAVTQISGAIETLPIHLFRRGVDGSRERASDDPREALIAGDASEFMGAGQLRAQLVIDALLRDFGLGFVNRVGGKPVEILRLDPGAVTISQDEVTGDLNFELATKTGKRALKRADLIYIPALATDGVKPVAPIKRAKEAIALAMTLEEAATRLFAKGAQPSGILSAKADLSPTAIERAKKIFDSQISGTENFGGTVLMPAQFEYARSSLSSVDAQFHEMRLLQIVEIARSFNIPPLFLHDYSRATWGNSETMARLFLQYTLAPWLKRIEAAYRHALIPAEERQKYFVEFNTDELLKADTQARASAYQTLIAARVINPNEARAKENLAPYEGGNEFLNPNTTSAPPPPEARDDDE